MKSKILSYILFCCFLLPLSADNFDLSYLYSDSFLSEITTLEYDATDGSCPFTLAHQYVSDDYGPFYRLSLSHKDEKMITKIISSLGEYNWVKLLMMKKELEKIGDKLADAVHPLRFTGFIFADPYLTHCMKEVKNHRFKWGRFLGGYSENMDKELKRNNLYQHVPGYCHETGADPSQIIHYIDRRDWEGLLKSQI